MFTASDLATAVQHRVAIKVVICNSGGYEAIRCHQLNRFGRSLATALTSPPDFARFAEAFGAEGLKLRHYEELPAALEQVLANDHVSVIDVPVAVKPM
jgi:acetolactate synthase-1/2/3 large subunit